jgi:hypothetical protein
MRMQNPGLSVTSIEFRQNRKIYKGKNMRNNMAKKTSKKKAKRKTTKASPAAPSNSDLERFLGYEEDFRNVIKTSKMPASDDVEERNSYAGILREIAKKSPENSLRKSSERIDSKTPRNELDLFASALSRVYNDNSAGFFDENRAGITKQIGEFGLNVFLLDSYQDELTGIEYKVQHAKEGSADRLAIIDQIDNYQALDAINKGYDTGKVGKGQILEMGRNQVNLIIGKNIKADKENEDNKYVQESTWGYVADVLRLIDSPDTPDEARSITGVMQIEAQKEVYEKLDSEKARADFVRESLGYLPSEVARPITYFASLLKKKEE